MMLAALVLDATLATAQPAASATPLASPAATGTSSPSTATSASPAPSPSLEPGPAPTGLPGNFTMPSNWISRSLPAFMPRSMIAFWTLANSAEQNVSIMRLDNYTGTMATYVAGADKGLAAMHAVVGREGPNPKCPAGTSDLVEHSDVMFERRLSIVQDAILDGHTLYLLTYTRLQSQPVDSAVIAALGTFCPPPPAN